MVKKRDFSSDFKRNLIELRLEYGALKVLIYPNNIAIIGEIN